MSKSRAPSSKSTRTQRFVGVSLGGGKTDKTCISVLEYYQGHDKLFLSRVYEKIRSEGDTSSDQQLIEILTHGERNIDLIAFDAPLDLPKCLRCKLRCPGYENCTEPEITWMWRQHRKNKRDKIFTPYTERCAETYISSDLEEPFHPHHALGANTAPLTARALFLKRRLKSRLMEVFPKLSIWRIGRSLRIPKSHLRFHRHAFGGVDSRASFLRALVDRGIVFIYDQDFKHLSENPNLFDAMVCALTAYLFAKGQCEKRPRDFPRKETWIEFPLEDLSWF